MKVEDLNLYQFYSFPEPLRGALQVAPYFQVLIYLPFLLQAFDTKAFVVTVAAHFLLFPLFFKVFWHKGYSAVGFVTALTALAVATSVFSLSGIGFFAYAAAACSACRQKTATLMLLVGVNSIYLISAYFLNHSVYTILVGLFFTAINGVNFDFLLRRYLSDRIVKQSQEEASKLAKVSERERIARDLHDLLGHSLTSISLKAELAERLLDIDSQASRQHLAEIQQISRRTLAQVREAVTEYKSNTFENELASARVSLGSVEIEFIQRVTSIDANPFIDATLAMILREAITNVLRHSNATRCTVSLQSERNFLVLKVDDNGRTRGEPPMGNGLRGVRERCNALGGRLQINFISGCHITVSIPPPPPLTKERIND
mgnify:CR=1 FL=1